MVKSECYEKVSLKKKRDKTFSVRVSPVVQCKDTIGTWEEGKGISSDWSVMGEGERAG